MNKKKRSLLLSRIVIWIAIIIVMFPALWIVMASFSKGDSFFSSTLFPEEFSLINYQKLFEHRVQTLHYRIDVSYPVLRISFPLTEVFSDTKAQQSSN